MDFDTFLLAQVTAGQSSVLPLREGDWVHPSQMICQFTEFVSRGRLLTEPRSNLLLIPYFMFAGGEERLLLEATRQLEAGADAEITFFGRVLSYTRMEDTHLAWLKEQASRLEVTLAGGMREPVARYFAALGQQTSACLLGGRY